MPSRALHRFLRSSSWRTRRSFATPSFNALADQESIPTNYWFSDFAKDGMFQCPHGPCIDSYPHFRSLLTPERHNRQPRITIVANRTEQKASIRRDGRVQMSWRVGAASLD